MFKKLKQREVTVFKRKNIRGFVGGMLGLAAGLSLTSTILPTVVSTFQGGEHFLVRFALADYAAHTALVWGVGGWVAARLGVMRFGAPILGIVGAVSGLLLAYAALGPQSLVVCAAGGAVYGTVGGLIISGIMPGDDERLMINFDRKQVVEETTV